MIAFLNGIIEDIAPDNVVIDVGGVGYNVKISSDTAMLQELISLMQVRQQKFQRADILHSSRILILQTGDRELTSIHLAVTLGSCREMAHSREDHR